MYGQHCVRFSTSVHLFGLQIGVDLGNDIAWIQVVLDALKDLISSNCLKTLRGFVLKHIVDRRVQPYLTSFQRPTR